MTQTETNRDIVRRTFEAWRDGTAAITDLFAPDARQHRTTSNRRRRTPLYLDQAKPL